MHKHTDNCSLRYLMENYEFESTKLLTSCQFDSPGFLPSQRFIVEKVRSIRENAKFNYDIFNNISFFYPKQTLVLHHLQPTTPQSNFATPKCYYTGVLETAITNDHIVVHTRNDCTPDVLLTRDIGAECNSSSNSTSYT